MDFFDTHEYLVLEGFLKPGHVSELKRATEKAISRRRRRHRSSESDPTIIIEGANTRIFYILEDNPLFIELIDHDPLLPYLQTLLSETPHFHASDAIWEIGPRDGKPGWHIDGREGGYRRMRPGIPLLQLRVGYFLSNMTQANQGNLTIVPASHRNDIDPEPEQLDGFDVVPGAIQLCVPAGSCVMFHNAL